MPSQSIMNRNGQTAECTQVQNLELIECQPVLLLQITPFFGLVHRRCGDYQRSKHDPVIRAHFANHPRSNPEPQ